MKFGRCAHGSSLPWRRADNGVPRGGPNVSNT
jgi:hypothetical protein